MIIILAGLVLGNWVSLNHARRMTQFAQDGERTQSPEELSFVEKVPLLLFGITVPRPENAQTPADFGLSFQTEYVSAGEHNLEVWKLSSKQEPVDTTIILFHGYAESKATLLPLAKSLMEMGVHVWLVDFRGSGGSTGNRTTIGFDEAQDVAAVFEEAKKQLPDQQIVLYGMSMGGAAVLRAVAAEQIEPDGIMIEAVFDSMLSTVQNRFKAMGVPSFPAANLLVFWGGLENNFNAFNHKPVDYARLNLYPTLMLHGEQDPRATLEEGERLFEAVNTTQKKLVVFEGVGHQSGHEANQALWEFEVQTFLESITDSVE